MHEDLLRDGREEGQVHGGKKPPFITVYGRITERTIPLNEYAANIDSVTCGFVVIACPSRTPVSALRKSHPFTVWFVLLKRVPSIPTQRQHRPMHRNQ